MGEQTLAGSAASTRSTAEVAQIVLVFLREHFDPVAQQLVAEKSWSCMAASYCRSGLQQLWCLADQYEDAVRNGQDPKSIECDRIINRKRGGEVGGLANLEVALIRAATEKYCAWGFLLNEGKDEFLLQDGVGWDDPRIVAATRYAKDVLEPAIRELFPPAAPKAKGKATAKGKAKAAMKK